MGLLGKLFGQPQMSVEAMSKDSGGLPPTLARALAELPDWLLINPSTNPPAETAAMDADFDLYMKWEALYHSACIGNCLFAVGAMRGMSDDQKVIAMQRVFSVLDASSAWDRSLVTRFMDHIAPTLERGDAPETAIGKWLLESLASEVGASPTIIEMANSPSMQNLHGAAVMGVTQS